MAGKGHKVGQKAQFLPGGSLAWGAWERAAALWQRSHRLLRQHAGVITTCFFCNSGMVA